MPQNANAPRASRGAAKTSVICAAKHSTTVKRSPTENQVVAVARIVGALLENYIDRRIALHKIGRPA